MRAIVVWAWGQLKSQHINMIQSYDARAELAHQIILHFRDRASGGDANLGEDAWWVEDMLDRIERAITPHLATLAQDDPETLDVRRLKPLTFISNTRNECR